MIKMLKPKVLGASVLGAAVGFSANYAVTKILFKPEQPLKVNGKTIPFAQGILPATQSAVANAAEKAINSVVRNPAMLSKFQATVMKPQVKDTVNGFIVKFLYETADKKSINELIALFVSDDKKQEIEKSLKEFISKMLIEKTDKEVLGNLLANEGIKIFKEVSANSVFSKLMNEKLFASIANAISAAVHKFVETSATQKILDIAFVEVDSLMDMTLTEILNQFAVEESKMKELLSAGYDALFIDIIPHLFESVEFAEMAKNLILKIDYSKVDNFLNTKCQKALLTFDGIGAVIGGLSVGRLVARRV